MPDFYSKLQEYKQEDIKNAVGVIFKNTTLEPFVSKIDSDFMAYGLSHGNPWLRVVEDEGKFEQLFEILDGW